MAKKLDTKQNRKSIEYMVKKLDSRKISISAKSMASWVGTKQNNKTAKNMVKKLDIKQNSKVIGHMAEKLDSCEIRISSKYMASSLDRE